MKCLLTKSFYTTTKPNTNVGAISYLYYAATK